MTLEAVALVKLPFDQVSAAFPSDDRARRVKRLEDGALVDTRQPFATEPDALSLWLRNALGAVYDQLDDRRGVFFFPDVARPKATTYDAVLEEVGELGQWAPKVAAGYVPKPVVAPLEEAHEADEPHDTMPPGMQDLLGAFDPSALADMQRALAGGDMGALAQLQGQLESMLSANPALAEQLQGAMQGMGGMPTAGADGAMPFGLPSEDDAPELWAQAREQAEAMMRENPALLAQLQAQFGGAAAGAADADEDDEEDTDPGRAKNKD